jgi:hypothetical protein
LVKSGPQLARPIRAATGGLSRTTSPGAASLAMFTFGVTLTQNFEAGPVSALVQSQRDEKCRRGDRNRQADSSPTL